MLRTIRRVVVVTAGAAALAVTAATGAGAGIGDLTQMESAARVNLQDIEEAAVARTMSDDADGTCMNPVVVGGPYTVAARIVVGETYGNDFAQADGHCLSYQGGSTVATLTVRLEYQPYPWAPFEPIPGCSNGTVSAPATNGVNVAITPVITCEYRLGNPAANRPHRAHAILTYGTGRLPYHGYSAVWFATMAASEISAT